MQSGRHALRLTRCCSVFVPPVIRSSMSSPSAPADLAITIEDVKRARERIAGKASITPVLTCSTMDRLATEAARRADPAAPAVQLFFKCENLQRIGAFKFRGAVNAVQACRQACATDEERSKLVFVTHSSGNHAQALAHAATLCGNRSIIVMPHNAPQVKVDAVRDYGAEIVRCDNTQAAREAMAEIQTKMHAPMSRFVPPYDDPLVMAGQGTLALELLEQVPNLDALVVPVGGGGMLSGVALAARETKPDLRVYAAEPKDADDAYQSIRAGERIPLPKPTQTVCDGLRTSLGLLTYPVIRNKVSGVVTASEEEVIKHMKLVFERMKIVIEPSAAVSATQQHTTRMHASQTRQFDSTCAV